LKILEKQLKKGFVKVVPESLDDFWHLYNIIYAEDQVYAKTTRIMKIEELYARPKKGKRVSVILGIRVQKVFWDRSLNRLRVHGIICEAPEDIGGIGSHHTLDVVLNKPISVVKSQWQKHQLERLERASHVETPLITVLAIDDEEYCVAVLRQYGMEVKGEKKTRLPSKMEPEKREEAFKAFFKSALQILRESWMSLRNLIVVIGPGFVKSNFVKYVQSEAPDIAEAIVDVKSVNSAGVAGINEALRSGVLANTLKNVRIAEETQLVEEVLTRLGKGTGNVAYGLDEVVKAIQYGAVEKLLLTDTMLREAPNEKRISLENIMRDVENKGGQVIIVSTEYEAGAQLRGLTGIVALLRFSIS
jgi:protein pelota